MITERRKIERRRVNLPAKVTFAPDTPQHDCIVVDISEVGARLAIDNAQDAPAEFTIVLSPCGRPYRKCRVVWRTALEMGVEFDRGISSHAYPELLSSAI